MRLTRRADGTRRAAALAATWLALACGGVAPPASEPDPLGPLLAPQAGIDGELAKLQQRVRNDPGSLPALERYGWKLIERARTSEDPGYYALAEQAAHALVSLDRDAGRLLRARALHGQHRFAEAERVARELVRGEPGPIAWAVLGDALFDQGRVDEAADAYERMMALRPDSQALARFAEVLFVRGDLDGAIDAMRRSARSVAPRHADAHAWTLARLARLLLVVGRSDAAEAIARHAVSRAPESVDAWLALGRVQLARDAFEEATESLAQAAARSQRPQLLWALADALRVSGREDAAREVEGRLLEIGARADERGFALYLASRGLLPEHALALARGELRQRRDVFTLATLAWCELRAGHADAAWQHIQQARVHGTRDAGLDLRAGVIAQHVGEDADARVWLGRARASAHLLLPSERVQLAAAEERLVRKDRG